jgi:hypothetical protein
LVLHKSAGSRLLNWSSHGFCFRFVGYRSP